MGACNYEWKCQFCNWQTYPDQVTVAENYITNLLPLAAAQLAATAPTPAPTPPPPPPPPAPARSLEDRITGWAPRTPSPKPVVAAPAPAPVYTPIISPPPVLIHPEFYIVVDGAQTYRDAPTLVPRHLLHNMPGFQIRGVADDERYIGEDGIPRPYGMVFPENDAASGSRNTRKVVPETGSFGKSMRRSRSRTATPGVKKVEDPTLEAFAPIFANFAEREAAKRAANSNRTSSSRQASSNLSPSDGNGESTRRQVHKEPTEVILRGFKQGQDYASIAQYERIAGMICEDYSRDPPTEQRKYKGSARDPAVMRKRVLTPAEKAKAFQWAGGDNWIKITFESAEAAEIAIENSPQEIVGYIVHAELYRNGPPTDIGPNPARRTSRGDPNPTPRRRQGSMSRSQNATDFGRGGASMSPPVSHSSSHTFDTETASGSSATVNGSSGVDPSLFCTRIPTARKIILKPAELALLPQQTFNQRVLANIPIISWLTSDMIGNEVPRTATGEFDTLNASFYWRFVWWLDGLTGWFDLRPEEDEKRM